MYVVTGATGHTGRVVAKALLEKGAKVRVLGRNPKLLESLASQGAEPLVVDLTDRAAITDALGGAKGAYLMLPPKLVSPDYRAFQNRVADAIAAAVKAGQARNDIGDGRLATAGLAEEADDLAAADGDIDVAEPEAPILDQEPSREALRDAGEIDQRFNACHASAPRARGGTR